MRPARALPALALVLAACPAHRFDQRDWARVLQPAPIAATSRAELRAGWPALTVRAYASPEYRGHDPEWQRRIVDQVRRASAVVEDQFGVRLEVESVREWGRPHEASELGGALEAVIGLDPATDVDWVVGFVGVPPETAIRTHDEIGKARFFGRHFVLRAMQSPRDLARLADSLDELSAEERAAIARHRREHGEASTFLHEWAHTLGAVHECDSKWIMSPRYSVLTSAFSPESARLVRVGLRHRDDGGREAAATWMHEWRFEARVMAPVSWECATLEKALADMEAWIARSPRISRWEAPGTAGGTRARYAAEVGRALDDRVRARRDGAPTAGGPAREARAVVEVRIDATGDLKEVRVVASSGHEGFDRSATAWLTAAKPFPPPPRELAEPDGEVSLELAVWWTP